MNRGQIEFDNSMDYKPPRDFEGLTTKPHDW